MIWTIKSSHRDQCDCGRSERVMYNTDIDMQILNFNNIPNCIKLHWYCDASMIFINAYFGVNFIECIWKCLKWIHLFWPSKLKNEHLQMLQNEMATENTNKMLHCFSNHKKWPRMNQQKKKPYWKCVRPFTTIVSRMTASRSLFTDFINTISSPFYTQILYSFFPYISSLYFRRAFNLQLKNHINDPVHNCKIVHRW